MPLHNFLLMNMYTILKYCRSHTKSSNSIYFKTFPTGILNCWSNSSDNVFLIYKNVTVNLLKFDFG